LHAFTPFLQPHVFLYSTQVTIAPTVATRTAATDRVWHGDCCLTFQLSELQRTTVRKWTMSQRETNLLWLRDLLEHMAANQKRLEWAEDADTVRLLTETMLRDLQRCQRLCEGLHQRSLARQAV
jgi:hypothetical protein